MALLALLALYVLGLSTFLFRLLDLDFGSVLLLLLEHQIAKCQVHDLPVFHFLLSQLFISQLLFLVFATRASHPFAADLLLAWQLK